jgi:predicted MFS family arabinose efflux permease
LKTFPDFLLWIVGLAFYFGLFAIGITTKDKDTRKIVYVILIIVTIIGTILGVIEENK